MIATQRIDFDFTPLQVTSSITADNGIADSNGVKGTLPAVQTYDNSSGTGVYIPDYTVANMVIQPKVSILDIDEVLPSGCVNGQLANCKWFEWINGVKPDTEIKSTDSNYDISACSATDTTQGQIKVKRNVPVNGQITLEFQAQYLDPRNNEIHEIRQVFTIRCESAIAKPPILTVDIPSQSFYNPITDPSQRIVTASLVQGGLEVPAANRIFIWEEMASDGTWAEIDPNELMNYDVSVNDNQLTVLREYMGYGLKFRVRAKYDKDGNPSAVTLTESAPNAVFNIIRKLPDIESKANIRGLPNRVPPGQKYLFPTVNVDGMDMTKLNGIIAFDWLFATNTATGNGQSYTKVAEGQAPQISTAAMAKSYGGMIKVNVRDCGPLGAALDSDGKVFLDSNGAVLII